MDFLGGEAAPTTCVQALFGGLGTQVKEEQPHFQELTLESGRQLYQPLDRGEKSFGQGLY